MLGPVRSDLPSVAWPPVAGAIDAASASGSAGHVVVDYHSTLRCAFKAAVVMQSVRL